MTADFRAAIALVLIFVALGFLFLNPGWVKPDSVGVYAYLRSAILDHDLSFLNEWAGFRLVQNGTTLFKETSVDGRVANHWWIGTAILSLPFYVVAHIMARILGLPVDGVTGIYTIVLAWCSVLFTALSLIIARSLVRDVEPSARRIALLAALVGTPLFFYTFRMPLGTHAAGTLSVALLVLILSRAPTSTLLLGLVFGFSVATRLQHFVLIGAVVVAAARERWSLRAWLQFAIGALIGWSPQGIAWWIIYGHPLGPLVKGASLAGTTWSPFRENALLEVLLSGWHGLFIWSPVALLAIIGWLTRVRRDRLAAICIAMFAGEWLANGLLDRYFWGGLSFGPRRFVDLAVPFAIGIAWFINASRGRVMRATSIAVTIGFSLWSAALLVLTFGDKLELAKDITVAELAAAMNQIGPAISAFNIASLRAFSLHAVGAVLILIAAVFVLRLKTVKPVVLAIAFLLIDAALLSLRPATLRNASADKRRFGIADNRATIGPLLDQQNLVSDLLRYRLRRGDEKEAERLRLELAAIERRIRGGK